MSVYLVFCMNDVHDYIYAFEYLEKKTHHIHVCSMWTRNIIFVVAALIWKQSAECFNSVIF